MRIDGELRRSLMVTLAYAGLTIVMTWPLTAGLARDVPGDLGDSLLNMWILGWGAESLPRLITGSMSIRDVWNANIFHPEPLALAFSEHLFGQVLQIAPLYYLTHNLILCYNLLFLSSFALSGLGMYLLVRDLTGNRAAGFAAGLFYAFVPFRVAQLAHIQTVSSQWMPLALYGFRRAIVSTTGPSAFASARFGWSGIKPLAGGTAALLMQNWSCGYYLIYFAPFLPIVVLHQVITAGRARDLRLWLAFGVAALVVAAGTWPFLALYLEAQRVHDFERPLNEVIAFSADVFGYFTAPEALRLWGAVMRAWPRPEGEVFLGVVPAVLAILAVGLLDTRPAGFTADGRASTARSPRRVLAIALGVAALTMLAGLAGIFLTGGFVTSVAGIPIRATNATRLLWQLLIVVTVLMMVSRDVRHTFAAFLRSPIGLAATLFVLAVWMSLGPLPHARGQTIPGVGLYGFFFDRVPGFEGLRAPSRYAMIAALFLSILAGAGLAAIARRMARPLPLVIAVCAAFLLEAAFVPMLVNQTWGDGAIVPPARVEPPSRAPAVYRQLAGTAGDLAIAEFPFGDPAWELRSVYYSTVHWKRILNGYSGGFPRGYKVRVALLQRVNENPDAAWQALAAAGTTHAIVHEAAFAPGEAEAIATWLRARGAREIGRFETDVLFELPR